MKLGREREINVWIEGERERELKWWVVASSWDRSLRGKTWNFDCVYRGTWAEGAWGVGIAARQQIDVMQTLYLQIGVDTHTRAQTHDYNGWGQVALGSDLVQRSEQGQKKPLLTASHWLHQTTNCQKNLNNSLKHPSASSVRVRPQWIWIKQLWLNTLYSINRALKSIK